jgi:hypothetical protein
MMHAPLFLSLVPSAPRTGASGNGDPLDALAAWGPRVANLPPQLRAQLNVTAISGTSPSLTVFIQDSVDGANWNDVGSFTAVTAVNRAVINITTPFNAKRLRVRWALGGSASPSATWDVKAMLF